MVAVLQQWSATSRILGNVAELCVLADLRMHSWQPPKAAQSLCDSAMAFGQCATKHLARVETLKSPENGAPAWMKLITTSPLEHYDISALGLRLYPKVASSRPSHYDGVARHRGCLERVSTVSARLTHQGRVLAADRVAGVEDAVGNQWWLAAHREDISLEEMKRRTEAEGDACII